MDNKETITIFLEEYLELLKDSKELQTLYNAGVDSWEGYEFAMNNLEEE